jgi:NAD(P)-dependent dehydrogenase (short-subunit alcohol dehydrogenase family)
MSSVFITGSADGLGQLAARRLVDDGHEVVLHARSGARAQDAAAAVPGAVDVLVGDLSSIADTSKLAGHANDHGRFDAVIHNAGVGFREPRRVATADGLSHVFAINVLAPYVLTALMERPNRLVYLTSGMHSGGNPSMADLTWERRSWNGAQAYSDSKLMDLVLAFAVARRWPAVFSNAVGPGWVATKMGGSGAPDDLDLGVETQTWLAVDEDPAARVSGRYMYHQGELQPHPAALDQGVQDGLLDACRHLSGVTLPGA